jgi:hypothetical protein
MNIIQTIKEMPRNQLIAYFAILVGIILILAAIVLML